MPMSHIPFKPRLCVDHPLCVLTSRSSKVATRDNSGSQSYKHQSSQGENHGEKMSTFCLRNVSQLVVGLCCCLAKVD